MVSAFYWSRPGDILRQDDNQKSTKSFIIMNVVIPWLKSLDLSGLVNVKIVKYSLGVYARREAPFLIKNFLLPDLTLPIGIGGRIPRGVCPHLGCLSTPST